MSEVKLQGIVYKTTIKPPKLDEEGFIEGQDLEIILRVPMDNGVRTKLADLSRMVNGRTSYIVLEAAQTELPLKEDK